MGSNVRPSRVTLVNTEARNGRLLVTVFKDRDKSFFATHAMTLNTGTLAKEAIVLNKWEG